MSYVGNNPGTAPTPGNLPSKTITAPTYNVLITDANVLLLGDATSGTLTTNLPSLASVPLGFTVPLKKVDSGVNTVILAPNGSDTINGLSTITLHNQYDGISVTAGNSMWYSYSSSNSGVSSSFVQAGVATVFTAQQNFGTFDLTDGATIAWPLATAQVAKVTLGGNHEILNPTGMVDGGTYLLKVTQDGTGSRILTYGTAYDFGTAGSPTLTTSANLTDWLTFVSNGTKMDFIGIAKGFA